jgi:glycosyltransferase involved in cell wall biosynthesis
VAPEDIKVIPSGVNQKIFRPLPKGESRREIAFPDDVFLITYIGRLEKWKGLDTLLKALQLADNPVIQAVIVGGPPSDKPFLSRADLSQEPFQQYIAMVDEYGLEKQVTFTGGKPQDQLAVYYSAGDVTVVPSYYEPFGIPALEALACGNSVIASWVSGLKSAVQENQVGTFFEPGNSEQLAEKIKILYEQPELNKKLRENARSYVEKNFSWMSVAQQVKGVYEELT